MLDLIKRQKLKRAAERSLLEFTKQAWSIVEPQQEFKSNWHLRLIAEHLEAVSAKDIPDLLINVPPGCMKSLLVSVMWPAWEWASNPTLRFLGASYGEDLALRDSQKTRDIIVSDWYRSNWDNVQIKKGEDQKIKYALTAGGWRMATSVGGRATGEHPDRRIVDDPHSALQAQSDAERGRAIEWFDQTLSTRGVSRGAATVVVMQRLHEKDVSGHILEDLGGYEHICLPMKYVPGKTAHREDPRKKEGELLWPGLFSEDTVLVLEKRLGMYGTAGQLQQQPSPPGGGVLRVDHFQLWPAENELPAIEFVAQSYDCAFTEKTTGDPSAFLAWGIFSHKGKKCALLLDAWAENLGYPALRKRSLEEWHAVYGKTAERSGKRADMVLVEKKASGQSLLQDLRQANIPARPYDPGSVDKLNRAHQTAPIVELDCLYIPESKKDPGEFVTWARAFVAQCEKFPNAEHDDYVDAFTQLMIYFRDAGMLELDKSYEMEDTDVDYEAPRNRRRNPYAA